MITAHRALWIAIGRSWGSLRGAHQGAGGMGLTFFLPFGRGILRLPAFGTPPQRGAKGGLLGAAPLLGPLCTTPGAPSKRSVQFPLSSEGTRLTLRELPSLAALAQVISLRDA